MKALKVTISGSYKVEGTTKETVDFDNFTKIIPFVPEEVVAQQVRARYARMWIIQDEKFKKRPSATRPVVYIDNIAEAEAEFSFVGKDIRAMSAEELQDFSVAFGLNRIPLFQTGDLRRMRTIAYVDYNNKILKADFLDEKEEGFNLMQYDAIYIKTVAERVVSTPIEKLIPDDDGKMPEGSVKPKKSEISYEDLKLIAGIAGIKHNPKITQDLLYEKIYGHVV